MKLIDEGTDVFTLYQNYTLRQLCMLDSTVRQLHDYYAKTKPDAEEKQAVQYLLAGFGGDKEALISKLKQVKEKTLLKLKKLFDVDKNYLEQGLWNSFKYSTVPVRYGEYIEGRGLVISDPVPPYSPPVVYSQTRGNKLYELTDQRGNVMAVVSDKKVQHNDNGDKIVDYNTADVVNATDYSPFGKPLPGRTIEMRDYKYGYNGKENDVETGYQNYGFRMYDPNIARFISVDPLIQKYPQLTPYQFASNSPIAGSDLDGLEFIPRFKQNDPFSLTSWAFAKKYQNSMADKIISGTTHGVSTSLRHTGNFFISDMWKASTWKNVGAFFEEMAMDQSTVKVYKTPLLDAKTEEFKEKVINGDAYSRSAYFSEFGTNMVTGILLDKGLGELGALKVFTNTGKAIKSASIRFTQNSVNDFGLALQRVGTGLYDPIDIIKMNDGIYSTIDNTRLLAAQKLGVNLKSNAHLFSDPLPETMLKRFKNNSTGQYAKTWGEAIENRTTNQTGGFAEQHGSNGTFVQPKINSH